MGYAISWLVVSGRDRQSLLDELGLQSTGNLGEVLDFKITGHALPDGAYLLVMDQCEHPFVSEKRLAQISLNCKVLACSIEEHVMYAYATYWTDGKNLWNMKHEGDTDKGRNDATVSGTPPDSFRAIRDDYAERQLGDPRVDWYFEMPLAMAKLLTGFKHDETNPGLDGSYEELAELSGSTKILVEVRALERTGRQASKLDGGTCVARVAWLGVEPLEFFRVERGACDI